jgi:hypothetical protein
VTVLGFNNGASITTLDAPQELVGTITPDPSGISAVLLRFSRAAGTVRAKKTVKKRVCKHAKGSKKKKCKTVKRVVKTHKKVPACQTTSGTKNYLVTYVCTKVPYQKIPGETTFRYAIPVALGTGTYSLAVVAVDGAGNRDPLEAGRNQMTFKIITTPSNSDGGGDGTTGGTTTTPTTTPPVNDTGSPFGTR